MKILKFIFNMILNVKNNTTLFQFLIFLILLVFLGVIGVISLLKVVIPFTYIAL